MCLNLNIHSSECPLNNLKTSGMKFNNGKSIHVHMHVLSLTHTRTEKKKQVIQLCLTLGELCSLFGTQFPHY